MKIVLMPNFMAKLENKLEVNMLKEILKFHKIQLHFKMFSIDTIFKDCYDYIVSQCLNIDNCFVLYNEPIWPEDKNCPCLFINDMDEDGFIKRINQFQNMKAFL